MRYFYIIFGNSIPESDDVISSQNKTASRNKRGSILKVPSHSIVVMTTLKDIHLTLSQFSLTITLIRQGYLRYLRV